MSSQTRGKKPAGSRHLFQVAPTETRPEVLAAQRLLVPEETRFLDVKENESILLAMPPSYHELTKAALKGKAWVSAESVDQADLHAV